MQNGDAALSLWDFLDAEGEIIKILLSGPSIAGTIYEQSRFSQPVTSKKLARLQDQGIVFGYRDPKDRRVIWYKLHDEAKKKLVLSTAVD